MIVEHLLTKESLRKKAENFMKPKQINKWKLFSNFLAQKKKQMQSKTS